MQNQEKLKTPRFLITTPPSSLPNPQKPIIRPSRNAQSLADLPDADIVVIIAPLLRHLHRQVVRRNLWSSTLS